MGIHHKVVSGKPTVDRSLEVFGQRAIKTESRKEPFIGIYSFCDLCEGLPFSHLSEELSLVLIKTLRIFEIAASGDQRKTESNLRVTILVP